MEKQLRSFAIRIAVVLGLIASILAWAQADQLINGIDSSDNVRRVLVDSSGRIVTSATSGGSGSHGACVNTTLNVGTTGTACPGTPRADRSSILIQLVQAGESLTIETGGGTATATVGAQISNGGSYEDDLLGTVSVSCRCTAATCSVRVVECP